MSCISCFLGFLSPKINDQDYLEILVTLIIETELAVDLELGWLHIQFQFLLVINLFLYFIMVLFEVPDNCQIDVIIFLEDYLVRYCLNSLCFKHFLVKT